MLGHFLRRDARDFLVWWCGIGVITVGLLLARLVLRWPWSLGMLFWAYMMYAMSVSNFVLGSVWRTQHQLSRYYLLSLPLAHKTLFAIQQARILVFWVPVLLLSSVVPWTEDFTVRQFSALELGLYYFGLLASVFLIMQMNLWSMLEMERVASYVPKSRRLWAWVSTMIVTFGVMGLLGVAWLDLLLPLTVREVRVLRLFAIVSWSGSSRVLFPGGLALAIVWAQWNARRWCVTL